jgi:hypothetical protein
MNSYNHFDSSDQHKIELHLHAPSQSLFPFQILIAILYISLCLTIVIVKIVQQVAITGYRLHQSPLTSIASPAAP